MQQSFGNFLDPVDTVEHLVIHFSPTSLPLQLRWRNNGLSADFLAEYWATFFPASDRLSQQRQSEIKGAINYIANELLENVMKFSYESADYAVDLKLYLLNDEFRFYSRNAIAPQTVPSFQQRIQELLNGNPQELYLHQIECNAQNPDKNNSQLGLLTMINDYGAQLAWRFEHWRFAYDPLEPELIILDTMVRLSL